MSETTTHEYLNRVKTHLVERFDDLDLDQSDLVVEQKNSSKGCRKYIQKLKLKYNCSRCSNKWTSSKGTTVFYYEFNKSSQGRVTLRFKVETFMQDCLRCHNMGLVTHYPQESTRISEKFAERILQLADFTERPERLGRLGSKMASEHEKELCHACKRGVCSLGE